MLSKTKIETRILWLTENYPPRRGGMAQACDRIVSGLRQKGVYIDVAFFNASASNFKVTSQMNGKLIAMPVSDSPAHSLNLLYNYVTDSTNGLHYTHVVAFGGTAPMLALPVFKSWLGVKAVTLLRGNDFDVGVFQPAKRQILFDALNASDTVCVLHKEAARRVSSLMPNANVVCIPNGIDTMEWMNDPFDFEEAAKFRKENDISEDTLLVGLFGQLKEKKGVTFFLDNVLRTGLQEKMTFLMVGDVEPQVQAWINEKLGIVTEENADGTLLADNPETQNISALPNSVSEVGEAENADSQPGAVNQEDEIEPLHIIQLPFMDRFELLSKYPACDYIALPSHYDGMPNVLLEAGALGIPAIAAKTGGITDVLPEEQMCITFHPGNADQCRQALNAAAAKTAEERIAIGQALKANIEQNFSQEKETAAYLRIFDDRSISC